MKKVIFLLLVMLMSSNSFAQSVVIGEGETWRGGYNACTTANIYLTLQFAWEEAIVNAEEECQSAVVKIKTIEKHWSCPLGQSAYARVSGEFSCSD